MGKWSKDEWTSLPVRKVTHKELTELGRKNENYDDIIRRLCMLEPIDDEYPRTWWRQPKSEKEEKE